MKKKANLLAALCALLRSLECTFPVDEYCYNYYVTQLDLYPSEHFEEKMRIILLLVEAGLEYELRTNIEEAASPNWRNFEDLWEASHAEDML